MTTLKSRSNSLIESRMGHYYFDDANLLNSEGNRVKIFPNFIDNELTVERVDRVRLPVKYFSIPASIQKNVTKCRIDVSETEDKNALSTKYMGGNRYYNWIADENGNEYVVDYAVSFEEKDFENAVIEAKKYRIEAEEQQRIAIQMHDDPHFGE